MIFVFACLLLISFGFLLRLLLLILFAWTSLLLLILVCHLCFFRRLLGFRFDFTKLSCVFFGTVLSVLTLLAFVCVFVDFAFAFQLFLFILLFVTFCLLLMIMLNIHLCVLPIVLGFHVFVLFVEFNEKRPFLLLNNLKHLNWDHVRKFVALSFFLKIYS